MDILMISSQPSTPCWTVGEKTHYWRILLSAALLFGGLDYCCHNQTDEEEYEERNRFAMFIGLTVGCRSDMALS